MFSLLFIISFWATLDSAWGLLSAVLSVSLSQPVSVLIYQDFIKLFRIKGFLKRLYWFNNQKWNQYIYIYLLCWLEELENEQLQFSMSKYEENRCDFFFISGNPNLDWNQNTELVRPLHLSLSHISSGTTGSTCILDIFWDKCTEL